MIGDLSRLSWIVWLPMAGVAVLLVLRSEEAMRRAALVVSLLTFALTLLLWSRFDPSTARMQFVESVPWVPSIGIRYALGVDGISLLFVVLTALLTIVSILVSWTAIERKVREFLIALFVMEAAMNGVFLSLDFFLFYLFWEAMLIPMYLLIGVWGGPARVYAAIKFFLYTLVGSVLMLVAILALYFAGGQTFDILALQAQRFSPALQFWAFLAFFSAFAVKVPMWPFHTWLPDAHTEAPTAGSVILAGILLKMGAYGFLRFSLPMFPDATVTFAPFILALSLIAIVYGALVTMVQRDLKKLIAYSSVSHMGFVTLGIFALNVEGVEGGILQMVNHGILTGALFLCVGIIYERTHSREIADYGGIARSAPVFSAFFLIFGLGSLGLPGMNGFVGEFLVLVGAFIHSKIMAVVAASGVILAAVYLLWMFQRVLFQEIVHPENEKLRDLNFREWMALLPLAVPAFLFGVYPEPLLRVLHASVEKLLTQVQAHGPTAIAWSQVLSFW